MVELQDNVQWLKPRAAFSPLKVQWWS